MSDAQLRYQRIDSSDLDSCSSASVAQLGGSHMVLSLRLKQWKRREPFDDLGAGLGARKALQEFLQHKPCRDNHICPQQSILELLNLKLRRNGVPPQCERPNARVYQ